MVYTANVMFGEGLEGFINKSEAAPRASQSSPATKEAQSKLGPPQPVKSRTPSAVGVISVKILRDRSCLYNFAVLLKFCNVNSYSQIAKCRRIPISITMHIFHGPWFKRAMAPSSRIESGARIWYRVSGVPLFWGFGQRR